MSEPKRQTAKPRSDYPLTEKNIKFAAYCANHFARANPLLRMELDDLVQIARLGMMRAERNFDPSRGVKFISYASFTINAFLARYYAHDNAIMPIPPSSQRKKNHKPVSVLDLENYRTKGTADDNYIGDAADVIPSLQVPAHPAGAPALDRRDVARGLLNLSEREMFIIASRYSGTTLRELADRYGVTRETIRLAQQRIETTLQQRRSLLLKPTKPKTKLTERQIQVAILREFATKHWCRLWRQNTGKAVPVWAILRFIGQLLTRANVDSLPLVAFGVPGSADLSGMLLGGRRLEIEVKSSTGRQSKRQKAYQKTCETFGAVYILARSIDDVYKGLRAHGFDYSRPAARG